MARNSNFDLDAGMEEHPVGSNPRRTKAVATPTARVAKPKLSAEEKRHATSNTIRQATRQRRQWEASPEGQARTQDITSLAGDLTKQTGTRHADIYRGLGVTNSGHGHGEQQLPGFENQHAAPEPTRWEDLPEKHRQQTMAKMREHGTSIEQMTSDFGAQFDQATMRAHQAGAHHDNYLDEDGVERRGEPAPFTKHFYGETPADAPKPLDEPQQMFRESREHLAGSRSSGDLTDPTIHSGAVALTSPNVKFTQGEPGNRTSPNTEAAEAVFKQHSEGIMSDYVTSGKNRSGITNQSRPANSRRAARMMEHVDAGGTMGSAKNPPSASNPTGSSIWGPKTGPFVNSFDSQHPDFLVADVHTGGGGMLPHLSTDKPLRRNADGSLSRVAAFKDDARSDEEIHAAHGAKAFQRDKSEREKAMEHIGMAIPGSGGKKTTFHAAADYAARMAIQKRGLGQSVRQPQAAQWGEEQLQRGEASPKLDVPHQAEAYPERQVNQNQFKLF